MNKTLLCIAAFCVLLSSCIKDKVTHHYKIKVPVYALKTDVYNNIHSNAPQQISNPGKMFLLNNKLFVTEKNKGIHIIDNANPSDPKNISFIPIPLNEDVAVKDNVLYADCGADMLLLDVSNPAAVSLIKYIPNAFPSKQYQYGYYVDSTRVIIDWIIKDTVADETIFNNYYMMEDVMVLSNQSTGNNGGGGSQGVSSSMSRFTIMNNYLYTVSTSTLYAYDITISDNPVKKNEKQIGWNVETIYPFTNFLLIGSQTGMYIFNVSNPADPVYTSVYTHINSCDPVIADGNYAYVTLRDGTTCQTFTNQLEVLNIQTPASPQLIKTLPLTNPHGLAKDGNVLLICDGAAGLRSLDASNPEQVLVKNTFTMSSTYDVIALNGIAYVTAEDGLYVFNYNTSDYSLTFLAKINITR
jgi:hypothetical protein